MHWWTEVFFKISLLGYLKVFLLHWQIPLVLSMFNDVFLCIGTLSFAELSTVVPKSGGCYAYYQASFKDMHPYFGPLPGFIFIWIMVVIIIPTAMAVDAHLFANYVYEPFRPGLTSDFNDSYENVIKTALGAGTLGN